MNPRTRKLIQCGLALLAALATSVTPMASVRANAAGLTIQVHLPGAELPLLATQPQHPVSGSLLSVGIGIGPINIGIGIGAPTPTPTPTPSPGPGPIDMKVLVVAADGKETDYPALKAFLSQIGVPYDVLLAAQTPLTASMLSDGGTHGYYEGIILTTGNLTYQNPTTGLWQSALNDSQWQTLWQYESKFKVRQVTSYTDPVGYPDTYGLNLVTYQDTTSTPLQASLTSSGQTIFPYLNASNPITFKNAWVYLAKIKDASVTTPLLTTADGYAIASINNYSDGRQNLAVTAANNPYLMHSMLLSYGVINWVTKGTFLGMRHVQMDATEDDLYIDDNLWNTTTLSDTDPNYTYRITGTDLTALLNWQQNVQLLTPNASSFRLEHAFVGSGAQPLAYVPDTLSPNVLATQSQWNFVNHTWTHQNLDSVTYDQAYQELQQNDTHARQSGFTNYWKDTMVQPDISGLYNSAFQQAAYDFGIRYMISDTSRAGWNNPTPNAGFYATYAPGILIIPRHPTNLFYNLSTPAEWVSEYNCYYGPQGTCAGGSWRYWNHNLSYAEILDVESNNMLAYLLKWDIDPLMFHQPNLRAYDGVHSLFSDLLDKVFSKYNSVYNLPIVNRAQHQTGVDMAQRMAYDASGAKASLMPCQSLTVTATKAAVVPVTGVNGGPAGTRIESYGGQNISYLNLAAGQSVTVPVTC